MKNKLSYTVYYRDGDTKSFPVVKNVYEGVTVVKKRMYWSRAKTCCYKEAKIEKKRPRDPRFK